MLIRLDNGNYINPEQVTGIRCCGKVQQGYFEIGDRVVIDIHLGNSEVIYKESFSDCLTLADELAKRVNNHAK